MQKVFSVFILFSFFAVEQLYAQWQPTNGPYGGGAINCLTTYNNYIYAGTSSGLYKTDASAFFWASLNDGLPGNAVNYTWIDSTGIYVSTDGAGIYASYDQGVTWNNINNNLPDSLTNCVARNNNSIYAGTRSHGLQKSDDGGASWTVLNVGLPLFNINSVAFQDTSTLYASARGKGIFKSTDNGATWDSINTGITNRNINSMKFFGGKLFAASEGTGVFISQDSGANWSLAAGAGYYVRNLTVAGNEIFASSTGGSYVSADTGVTWTIYHPFSGFVDYAASKLGSTMFAGTFGAGMYKSTNGGATWTETNGGIKGIINKILYSGNKIYALAGNSSIFESSNFGNTWFKISSNLPDNNINTICAINDTVYAGLNTGLYKTTNSGFTWTLNSSLGNNVIRCIAAKDSLLFANGPSYSLYKSEDNGNSWYNCGSFASTISTIVFNNTHAFAIHGAYVPEVVYRSSDWGDTWTDVSNGLTGNLHSLTVSNSNVYITKGSDVVKSINSGNSWVSIGSGLPTINSWQVEANEIYPVNNSLLAGMYLAGIYVSNNNGSNWIEANAGLKFKTVTCFKDDGNNIYIGTNAGVWRSPIDSIVTSVNQIEEKDFASFVFPNPFSEFTTIKFNNAKKESCTLTLYDLSGRVVRSISNINTDIVRVEKQDLSNGLYIFTLRSLNTVIAKGKLAVEQ